ncbi:MAG: transporter [Bdellovibrionales bacterium]|nr:transporter [Bdellovibrionales bacterium]
MAVFCVLLLGQPVQAIDSTEVLPASINSPSVCMGVVSGIGFRFLSSGDLMSLSDHNSIEFDARALTQFEPRVNEMVAILNQFGSQRMGDQLTLGVLRVDTTPEVRYVAPIYARGITSKWTLGVGVPVISYQNKLALYQTHSNIQAMRAEMGNSVPPELDAAFDELTVNLVSVAHEQLATKGYKPLRDRAETQIGDVQVVSLYQFAAKDFSPRHKVSAQFKTIVSLPTGQGDDPDDLADLGIFGYTAVENQLLGNYVLNGRLQLALKGGHRYTLPDQVIRRVPMNAEDTLPDLDSKETVSRETGHAWFAGASLSYAFNSALNLGVGVETTQKAADRYKGTSSRRHDLLGKDTASQSDRFRIGLSYSSIDAFFAERALLPIVLAYEFSDTIRGFNTERMTVHEVWLQLFF